MTLNSVEIARQLRRHVKKSLKYSRVMAAQAGLMNRKLLSCQSTNEIQTASTDVKNLADGMVTTLVAYYATL